MNSFVTLWLARVQSYNPAPSANIPGAGSLMDFVNTMGYWGLIFARLRRETPDEALERLLHARIEQGLAPRIADPAALAVLAAAVRAAEAERNLARPGSTSIPSKLRDRDTGPKVPVAGGHR
jgi:hypothetical protein